jgi:hypothetical protein
MATQGMPKVLVYKSSEIRETFKVEAVVAPDVAATPPIVEGHLPFLGLILVSRRRIVVRISGSSLPNAPKSLSCFHFGLVRGGCNTLEYAILEQGRKTIRDVGGRILHPADRCCELRKRPVLGTVAREKWATNSARHSSSIDDSNLTYASERCRE